ncbi:MAG: glutamine amidotransferase [Bifidobacteriaceae bacterium]|jgi:CobQ-like glutamine amidotransferase family enzyme|nr:glutamine amidotransferase [Bifidobacteriaceae bacterium]
MSDALGIVHVFPSLMGTYGDGGNVAVLANRARRRGIAVTTTTIGPDDRIPRQGDLYVVGGGEDHGQIAAARRIREQGSLNHAADAGATVFAVCAGLQVLGVDFEVEGGAIEPGACILDLTTRRREPRAVGEVLADPLPRLGLPPLTGYENHGGGSLLGPGAEPLAQVRAGIGNGSGGAHGDGTEGVLAGRVLGTYLHGPVLARNPELADLLLTWATGHDLQPLDAPFVAELRAERAAYVASGKLSPPAA